MNLPHFAGGPKGFPRARRIPYSSKESPVMRSKATGVIFALIFLIGLSLLLYPGVSNYWNEQHQSKAVSDYVSTVAKLDEADYSAYWQAAADFNRRIAAGEIGYELTEEQEAAYNAALNVGDTGVIGYVDIPAAKITLPIYHGTEESVLQVAVGHLPWTSLPVGGAGTHCVISGHRGLPSARLFTDIDKLVVGDRFSLNILNETLTYEVDRILIVLPEEVDGLRAEQGQDYCTLLTCTPYGVNTHRLLVRGHRVENDPTLLRVHVVSEAGQVSEILIAAVIFIAVIIFILIFYGAYLRLKRSRNNKPDILKRVN